MHTHLEIELLPVVWISHLIFEEIQHLLTLMTLQWLMVSLHHVNLSNMSFLTLS